MSKGKFWQNRQNQHPLSDCQKMCHRWLCRWPYSGAKFGADLSMGSFSGWVKYDELFFTARSELHKVLFLAVSVTFLFVYEIFRKPLNGSAPNSQGRRVSSLGRVWRSRSPGTKNVAAHCKVMGRLQRPVQKWLNWSTCCFGRRLGWAKGTMY